MLQAPGLITKMYANCCDTNIFNLGRHAITGGKLGVLLKLHSMITWLETSRRMTCNVNKKLCYRRKTARRDVSVKMLPMLHNSVETTCVTSPEQIEVMEIEGYSWPTTTTRSTVVGVIHKLTVQLTSLFITPRHRRLAVAKFSKSKNVEITHMTLTTPT